MENTKFVGFTYEEIMFGVVGIVIIIIISCIISFTMTTVSSQTSISKTVSITKTPDSNVNINNSSKHFEESNQITNISSSNKINL